MTSPPSSNCLCLLSACIALTWLHLSDEVKCTYLIGALRVCCNGEYPWQSCLHFGFAQVAFWANTLNRFHAACFWPTECPTEDHITLQLHALPSYTHAQWKSTDNCTEWNGSEVNRRLYPRNPTFRRYYFCVVSEHDLTFLSLKFEHIVKEKNENRNYCQISLSTFLRSEEMVKNVTFNDTKWTLKFWP